MGPHGPSPFYMMFAFAARRNQRWLGRPWATRGPGFPAGRIPAADRAERSCPTSCSEALIFVAGRGSALLWGGATRRRTAGPWWRGRALGTSAKPPAQIGARSSTLPPWANLLVRGRRLAGLRAKPPPGCCCPGIRVADTGGQLQELRADPAKNAQLSLRTYASGRSTAGIGRRAAKCANPSGAWITKGPLCPVDATQKLLLGPLMGPDHTSKGHPSGEPGSRAEQPQIPGH